jgi:hypothetical protein
MTDAFILGGVRTPGGLWRLAFPCAYRPMSIEGDARS